MLKITTPKKGDILFQVSVFGHTQNKNRDETKHHVSVTVEEITIMSAGPKQCHYFINRLGKMSESRIYTKMLSSPHCLTFLVALRSDVRADDKLLTDYALECLVGEKRHAVDLLESQKGNPRPWYAEHVAYTARLLQLSTIPIIIDHC